MAVIFQNTDYLTFENGEGSGLGLTMSISFPRPCQAKISESLFDIANVVNHSEEIFAFPTATTGPSWR
ncbi:MAG: hypothetical protein WBE69_16225 [Candidatus Binataceae bacterium]